MKTLRTDRRTLERIYKRLFARFGPQRWWPGESPFEVMVGAILTQNTAWSNASLAITRLKQSGLLRPGRLLHVPQRRLACLIRPSGYFNQKAGRLKGFLRFFWSKYRGDVRRMRSVPLSSLREKLSQLSGIGPETADSILLYALGKPSFVVDAYTRRVLARHSLISWEASYHQIQMLFESRLPRRARLFNEYHALLVALGKQFCRKNRPKCQICPLRSIGILRLEKNSC